MIQTLMPNIDAVQRQMTLEGVIAKAIYPFDKLEQYSHTELDVEMGIYRACRLLNPYWIRKQTIVALDAELV
jgi:hypothetical protein